LTDSFSDALDREWQLAKGFGRGVAAAPARAWDSWGYSLALGLGTGVAAFGLGAFGRLASPALSAVVAPTLAGIGSAMNFGLAVDAASWLYRAGSTAGDTWLNRSHLEDNIARAENLGTEAAGTAALLGTGLAGFKLAGVKPLFYNEDNLGRVFGNLKPDDVPRMQMSKLWGRRPSIEPPGSELAKFYHEQSPAVGQLMGETTSGTAFYAHPEGLWLTNYHVVQGHGPLVLFHGDRAMEAVVAAVDPRVDVAVVATNPLERVRPVTLAATSGEMGIEQPAVIIGHPDGVQNATITSTNTFRYPAPIKDGKAHFELDPTPGPTKDGLSEYASRLVTVEDTLQSTSGSPIFHKETKEALGMVSTNFGGVSSEQLAPVLNEALANLHLVDQGKVLKLSASIKAPSNEPFDALLKRPVEIGDREIIDQHDVLHAPEKMYPAPAPTKELGNLHQAAGLAGSMHISKLAYDEARG
jgi:hypothetical protein